MKAILLHDSGPGATLSEGAPRRETIVYVPGIDGTGELLLGTSKRLEARFRLLRVRYDPEPPSDERPGGAPLYERLADTIAECLDEAGVPRAVILAESFGGGVALQLALRHPDRVVGLMLVNTFCFYPRRIRIRLGAALVPFTPKKLLQLGRISLAAKLFFRPRKDAEAEELFRQAIPGFARGGYAERMRAIPELDLRDRLGEVTARCELFCSSDDAVVPSTATMQVLADGLPNAQLTTLEGANHIVLPLAEEPWVERLEELFRSAK
ncbi:2-hydroxymuconate semialdehyde hydrolase [Planctomycetes bacterium Poly30]|uniref:2-hydroxymuconate semialdehyde hydrolase n=1 Tax=Saltatorellus ferox TaxID=2528018 RepID=A0A518EVL5_9BACT|nr:2-hydroxymuconate semialdehyde hydrolase [Planctomycetes bacterium Poly30]